LLKAIAKAPLKISKYHQKDKEEKALRIQAPEYSLSQNFQAERFEKRSM
jgi:hypothetical protein